MLNVTTGLLAKLKIFFLNKIFVHLLHIQQLYVIDFFNMMGWICLCKFAL